MSKPKQQKKHEVKFSERKKHKVDFLDEFMQEFKEKKKE